MSNIIKLDFLKQIYDYLRYPDPESLKLSMNDVHHVGIFSLVIKGTEFGKLTRVFIADTKLLPYEVQLHTHRYPIRLTTIKGNIRHFVAVKSDDIDEGIVSLSEFNYKSPLNGGEGLSYVKETGVIIKDYNLPVTSSIYLNENDFHTMSCNKGSMWIVEEQGFRVDSSKVLGVPFITKELYNPPGSFQINDKCQLVMKEIKKLILDFELVQ